MIGEEIKIGNSRANKTFSLCFDKAPTNSKRT